MARGPSLPSAFHLHEDNRPIAVRTSSNSTVSSAVSSAGGSSASTAATDYTDFESTPLSSACKDIPSSVPQSISEQCPFRPKPQEEFQRIRQACPVLSSTGCTKEFCQSGRMIRTDEPRVGRNRPLAELQREAAGFLLECRKAGVITTDAALDDRLRTAAREINEGAVEDSVLTEDGRKETGMTGGSWVLSHEELLYGVRAAWRNSKRCIMRSQHMELELCDLRHIHTSKEMGEALVEGMIKAFNNGSIQPTAFMFPPREAGKTGPMVWNGQILAFAGYRQRDGAILGDPANADLTEAIIELGWNPPENHSRTQWDLLPLVTMAEGDDPALTELPQELQQVVKIGHSRYRREFEELGLRWVAFPALSRLGFDLGGCQFTASPFIGWFMDAEIGVRNLADSFRYNMLPKIAKALEAPDDPEWDIDDFPEYERLAMLSRAQTELNYAVNWSFIQAKVMMSDSLTASARYTQYDDEHLRENGYRLPADPYWLAPPIGSIIPIWHRGGAPNYQPKPLIARHVQDPIKAWRRKRAAAWATMQGQRRNELMPRPELFPKVLEEKLIQLRELSFEEEKKTTRIYYCSAGVTAMKLAAKLHSRVSSLASKFPYLGFVQQPRPLNQFDAAQLRSDDVTLVVASSTGRGEMPSNGTKFIKSKTCITESNGDSFFAIFGNGDSTYGDTYNAAAAQTQTLLEEAGLKPIAGGVFDGDSSVQNPPWNDFNSWWERVRDALLVEDKTAEQDKVYTKEPSKSMVRSLLTASLEGASAGNSGIAKVSLNLGDVKYQEMDHVRVFPPNPLAQVHRALTLLDLHPESPCQVGEVSVTLSKYLTEYADLEMPFKSLDWLSNIHGTKDAHTKALRAKPAIEVFELLGRLDCDFSSFTSDICADMATIKPRVFSAASSLQPRQKSKGNILDLLVKITPNGRFSDTFLSQAYPGATMRYTISPFPASDVLFPCTPSAELTAPIVAITTGSGIGPVRSLLQQRIASASRNSSKLGSNADSAISLFAGFKTEDASVIAEVIRPAQEHGGILDLVELVPSNKRKVRVQDRLLDETVGMKEAIKKKLKHPRAIVFVCTGEEAAKGINMALDALVQEIQQEEGQECLVDAREWMGDRYVEEVFRH